MHKQSDLEFNETELCVWHQDYLRSPPLMVRRHVLVFKDLLTYILKVKFTLRSAIREFDISLKMYEFCRKPFRPGFLCEAVLLLAPLLQRATAGLGITGRSDTIILQSNWHNQRLHKSYRHSQAPGRPLRWQFHGSPPECYLPISREWQIQRAGPPHCHTDRSCCGGLFSKMKTVMIYRLPAPSCSYTAGLQLYEIRIISRCLSAGGAFVAWWHQALSALLFQL